jgi:uncharacterized protein (DUF488 family)
MSDAPGRAESHDTDGRERLVVYTIGHGVAPVAEVIAGLERHAVALVVDVRSVPYSQWTPQFNREAIERALATVAIGYAFAGDYLGGRPTDPTCYKAGVVPEGEANYLALVDYDEVARRPWYRRGLTRLIELARERPTAIMCSEEEPDRCHRHHLIAQSLLALGIEVRHIRRDGTIEAAGVEPKQLSLLP